MTEEKTVSETSDPGVSEHPPELLDPVNPDKLLGDFRGKPLLVILLVVLVLHAVLIGAISAGGMLVESAIGGESASEDLPEDERMALALKDGESELRKIAGTHGVSYRDLKAKLGTAPAPAPAAEAQPPVTTPEQAAPEAPASEYEQGLNKAVDGPVEPDLSGGLEEEDEIAFPSDAP